MMPNTLILSMEKLVSGKIIIITGYLASGKSTFARLLSKETNVPYLIKDTFKIALCENIPITNREESSRFSAVTFNAMMYVTERLMETGSPIIIEGNFVPAGIKKTDEAGAIKALTGKYGFEPLTFKFSGDTQILHKRFIAREKTPERGQANMMFAEIPYNDFDRYCHNLDGFDAGGKIIEADTTDFNKVDFGSHIETARVFMNTEARR
ncbi:MAG: AAA family ATPase [Treponema sp.]|jgi:predicted kinase|nr:AAA family ATPase [Treponema sp.]